MVRGTRWKARGAVLVVRILPWIRIFCIVHLFRVPRSLTGSVQMKSNMIFIRGNRCIEKEKFTIKTVKFKRLKDCAQALTINMLPNKETTLLEISAVYAYYTCDHWYGFYIIERKFIIDQSIKLLFP